MVDDRRLEGGTSGEPASGRSATAVCDIALPSDRIEWPRKYGHEGKMVMQLAKIGGVLGCATVY